MTYIYIHILIYYDILCHIVIYSTWYIELISYSDLCTTSPSTTRESQSWSQRFRPFFMGGTSQNFKARNPQLQKRRSDSEAEYNLELFPYVHDVPLILIWSIFEKPFICSTCRPLPSITGASPPQVHGVSLESLDIAMNRIDFRGALVTWWKMSLATGLYRQIWVCEPLFSDVFWSVALFLSPSKGGCNRKNVQQWSMPIYVATWNNWW